MLEWHDKMCPVSSSRHLKLLRCVAGLVMMTQPPKFQRGVIIVPKRHVGLAQPLIKEQSFPWEQPIQTVEARKVPSLPSDPNHCDRWRMTPNSQRGEPEKTQHVAVGYETPWSLKLKSHHATRYINTRLLKIFLPSLLPHCFQIYCCLLVCPIPMPHCLQSFKVSHCVVLSTWKVCRNHARTQEELRENNSCKCPPYHGFFTCL